MIQNPVVNGAGSAETVMVTFSNTGYDGSWILADGTEFDFSRPSEANRTISVPKGGLLALRIPDANGPIVVTNGSVGINYTAYQNYFTPINALGIFTPLTDLVFDLDD